MNRDGTPGGEVHPLQPVFQQATDAAADAMRRWTQGAVSLSLDKVSEAPLEEAVALIDVDGELLTMVVLTLDGQLGGQLILAFDDVNGRQLAAALMRREPSVGGEWTAVERSALMETGNILGCAYLNALTPILKSKLVPSPPYFIQDFGASVLEQALMAQAIEVDRILIGHTRFRRDGEDLRWNVFFVPTIAMRGALEDAAAATA